VLRTFLLVLNDDYDWLLLIVTRDIKMKCKREGVGFGFAFGFCSTRLKWIVRLVLNDPVRIEGREGRASYNKKSLNPQRHFLKQHLDKDRFTPAPFRASGYRGAARQCQIAVDPVVRFFYYRCAAL
jgi:hypothetical protein